MNHKEAADAIHAWTRQMTGTQFEEFAVELLALMGARSVVRSGAAGDGGIDGRGVFFGDIRFAFQAKQWDRDVPPKEVRDFIGALTNEGLAIGYFFASGRFTQQAREEADKAQMRGLMVKLYDGERIADAMIRDRHGVKEVRRPVLIFDEKWWEKRLGPNGAAAEPVENGDSDSLPVPNRPRPGTQTWQVWEWADQGKSSKEIQELGAARGFLGHSVGSCYTYWCTRKAVEVRDSLPPGTSNEELMAAMVAGGLPEKVARHRLGQIHRYARSD